MELVEQRVQLLPTHRRPPLVDLGQRAGGWVDDRCRGARLVVDADEVAEDRLGRELVEDAVSGSAAGEAARDCRGAEPLQRPRDVDAFPAGGGQAAARAMAVTELEV